MIYTCTINPSLDYYMDVEKPLKSGALNRSSHEYYAAGGKGINVSIVLNNLNIPSRALGFIGGFSKDFFISLLGQYSYIEPVFNSIKGNTRINVKINGKKMTELNAEGPKITEEDLAALAKKLDKLMDRDILVLSGACPDYLKSNVVELVNKLCDRQVKVVLDCEKDITLGCLASHPFLINLNLDELSELMDEEILDEASLVSALKDVVAKGAKNVMVRGLDHSYLACEDAIYVSNDIEGERVNEIGASSSAIAGFVMNYNRSHNIVESFKFANSAAAATTFEQGLGTKDAIEALADKIEVKQL